MAIDTLAEYGVPMAVVLAGLVKWLELDIERDEPVRIVAALYAAMRAEAERQSSR